MNAITPAVAAATAAPRQALTGDDLGMDAAALKRSVLQHLEYTLAELPRHVDSDVDAEDRRDGRATHGVDETLRDCFARPDDPVRVILSREGRVDRHSSSALLPPPRFRGSRTKRKRSC